MFRLRAVPSKLGAAAAAASPLSLSMRCSSSGAKDFYKTLGVSKTATKDEVKKAYRKRAMETHPDQGGKKEEFAEVAEAYECLSNPERRQVYDQYGSEAVNNMNAGGGGPGGMGGFGGRDPRDVFSEFFRGFGGGPGGFGGDGGAQQQVAPTEVHMKLTLEEILTGCSKTVRATKPTTCSDCRGNGTKSQQPKPKCSQCQGSGHVMTSHRMGAGMVQQMVGQCPRCSGTGTVAKKDDECLRCHGAGYRNLASDTSVQVPPGVPSSATMILEGQGGSIPNAIPGDLHIVIEQVPHSLFTRRGDDLTATFDVTLAESLLGIERPLKLLDGKTVCVKTNPDDGLLKQNSVVKLSGEGMPKGHGGRGDVYIYINVNMPRSLTPAQRDAIRTAFGTPTPDANATAGNIVHGKLLKDSKEQLEAQKASAWQNSGQGGRGASGQSGRGRRGGSQQGQNVECAQQ